jgi:hypothetical protein
MNALAFKNRPLKITYSSHDCEGSSTHEKLYVTTQLVTPLNIEKREEENVSVNI